MEMSCTYSGESTRLNRETYESERCERTAVSTDNEGKGGDKWILLLGGGLLLTPHFSSRRCGVVAGATTNLWLLARKLQRVFWLKTWC